MSEQKRLFSQASWTRNLLQRSPQHVTTGLLQAGWHNKLLCLVESVSHFKPGLHYRKFLARLGWNWHGCQKRARQTLFTLHLTIFTAPKIPCQNFLARVSSLGDMRSSIRSKDGRRSLPAVALKKDVSQSSKLNYGHWSWQKFAGKNPLP